MKPSNADSERRLTRWCLGLAVLVLVLALVPTHVVATLPGDDRSASDAERVWIGQRLTGADAERLAAGTELLLVGVLLAGALWLRGSARRVVLLVGGGVALLALPALGAATTRIATGFLTYATDIRELVFYGDHHRSFVSIQVPPGSVVMLPFTVGSVLLAIGVRVRAVLPTAAIGRWLAGSGVMALTLGLLQLATRFEQITGWLGRPADHRPGFLFPFVGLIVLIGILTLVGGWAAWQKTATRLLLRAVRGVGWLIAIGFIVTLTLSVGSSGGKLPQVLSAFRDLAVSVACLVLLVVAGTSWARTSALTPSAVHAGPAMARWRWRRQRSTLLVMLGLLVFVFVCPTWLGGSDGRFQWFWDATRTNAQFGPTALDDLTWINAMFYLPLGVGLFGMGLVLMLDRAAATAAVMTVLGLFFVAAGEGGAVWHVGSITDWMSPSGWLDAPRVVGRALELGLACALAGALDLGRRRVSRVLLAVGGTLVIGAALAPVIGGRPLVAVAYDVVDWSGRLSVVDSGPEYVARSRSRLGVLHLALLAYGALALVLALRRPARFSRRAFLAASSALVVALVVFPIWFWIDFDLDTAAYWNGLRHGVGLLVLVALPAALIRAAALAATDEPDAPGGVAGVFE